MILLLILVRTFHLLHARQFSLPEIVEGMSRRRLEIPSVLSHPGTRCVATRAHARVISESTLVQIRMRQGIHHGDPLVLWEHRRGGSWSKYLCIIGQRVDNDCPPLTSPLFFLPPPPTPFVKDNTTVAPMVTRY